MTIEKNKEKVEGLKKDDKTKLKTDFLKDFVSSKLKEKNPNDFIVNAMKSDSITKVSGLKSDLEKYKAYIEKYASIDLSDINIFDIKAYLSKDFFELESSRKNLQKQVLGNYDISENDYKKIQKDLDLLNPSQIKEYLKNEKKLKDYLSSLFGKQIDKKSSFDFIQLSKEEVERRLSKLKNDEDKQEVKRILYDIDRLVVRDYDIRTLCEFDFLNDNEQRKIIKSFIPFLNLKEAIELGFINEQEALKERKKALKDVLSIYNFSDKNLETIAKKINDEDIIISTTGFDTKILSDKIGLSNLEEVFSSVKQEAEEEFKKTGPQDLKTLIKELSDLEAANSRFLDLAKFEKDNIIKFSSKKVSGEEEISYLKIVDTDDTNSKLSFVMIGEGKTINLKVSSESNDISYKEFFQKIQNSSSKMEFFTKKEIEDKLKDPQDTDFIKSELELFKAQDLEDENKTKEYIDFYKQNLQKEIDELEDEFTKKGGKEEENSLLVEQIKDKKEELKQLTNSDPSTPELLWFLNKQKLIEKLDEIDPDGKKLGFKKGLFLETKEGWTHEAEGIDYETGDIYISSNINGKIVNEKMNFELFFASFKEHEAKRVQKITDFKDFVDIFKIKNKDSWGDYAFENGNFIAKDVEHKDKKQDLPVEYLVSDKENDIIKIENISGDKITVAFGERKNAGDLDKKDKNYKKDSEQEILFINGAPSHTYSLNEFKKIIEDKKYNFRPDWKTGRKDTQIQPKNEQNDFHKSFATRLFSQRLSISEIMAGGKMFVSNITDILKRGNDLHSARFALAMSSILPAEISSEFLIKVEAEESEAMDKALKGLGSVDSPIATGRIEKWLLNKDTPEHKKEAGMLFMLSKYGTLTAKGRLYPYKGKWLWYEAFGGRVNDKLFLEVKKDCELSEVPFTEEKLMHMLIKKQCNETGYNGRKRRSRLHKEFEGKAAAGLSEEIDKGNKDTAGKRTFTDKIKSAKGEIYGGTMANGIGAFENAISAGASMREMNEIPFIILFSGAGYGLREELLRKFKSFTGGLKYGGLVFTRFLSTTTDMENFNKTVVELSKIYEQKDSKYLGMHSRALKIFENRNQSGNEKTRMEEAEKFWKDYGEPLTNTMNLLNNKGDKYSQTDKIILLEKEKNPILNNYYETFDSFVGGESDFSERGIMRDQFINAGTSGMSYKVLSDIGDGNPDGTFRKKDAAKGIWNELIGEVLSVKTNYNFLNEKEQIELLKRPLSYFAAYVKERGNSNVLSTWKDGGGDVGLGLNRIGIVKYFDEIFKFSSDELSRNSSSGSDQLLIKIAKDILSNNSGNQNNSVNNSNYKNPFKDTIDDVKGDIDDTIAA